MDCMCETADGGVLWIRDYFRVVFIDGVHRGVVVNNRSEEE